MADPTVIIDFEPNWAESPEMEYAFDTIIQSTNYFKQQRRPLIPTPTRKQNCKYSFEKDRMQYARNLLLYGSPRLCCVPIYSEPISAAAITQGASAITASTDITYFWNIKNCSYAVILNFLTGQSEMVKVASVSGQVITLSAAIAQSWTAAQATIYPAFPGKISAIKEAEVVDSVGEVDVEFSEISIGTAATKVWVGLEEQECNPYILRGDLIIHGTSNILYSMVGFTGTVASTIGTFTAPVGGNWYMHTVVTPAGDIAKLWYGNYSGGVYEYRIYVFVGLSSTVRYYFTLTNSSGLQATWLACDPATGRFIVTGTNGATRGLFYIYEPDGTYVTAWLDSDWTNPPYAPYNMNGASILGFLTNGNMVCIYRNAYLVYYQGYDCLYVYPSLLGGTRLYPTGNYYKVGPIVHNSAHPTTEPYSEIFYVQQRLRGDYIYGIHADLSVTGYYKFKLTDLVTVSTSNVTRVQLPASTFYPVSPGHDTTPSPHDGMALI